MSGHYTKNNACPHLKFSSRKTIDLTDGILAGGKIFDVIQISDFMLCVFLN